jgi:adenosine deaminase
MDFKKLPKVELHLHIDCSLSYEVVKKIDPSITQQQYMQEFVPAGKCTNLDDFLNRSVKGYQLMQTEERIAWVIEDVFRQLKSDNVMYAELRFAPFLHVFEGLTIYQVAKVAADTTEKCMEETGVEARLILCTLRQFSESQSLQTAELVNKFKGTCIVGFDIAGFEAGFPVDKHIAAFEYAHANNIFCTAHAGEAVGPESVWETLEKFKPSRIGHGVRSIEDEKLIKHLCEQKIHLEVCPSCNVLIDIYDTIQHHPIDQLYKAGVSLNVNTDNLTLTRINLTDEYELLHKNFGWQINDFYTCNLMALEASFIPEVTKEKLKETLRVAYT